MSGIKNVSAGVVAMLELIFNLDREIILLFRDMCASPAVASTANLFTMIGYGVAVWTVIVILISVRSRDFRIFLCWMIICGTVFVVGDLALKNFVQRTRPFTDMPFLVIRTVVPTSYSFPSSHAAFSGAGFCFVALVCRRRMVTVMAGVLAFAVAASRIILLVHYPSDVLCGFILGTAVAVAVYRMMGMKKIHGTFGDSADK